MYWARPTGSRVRSLVSIPCRNASAWGPVTQISPMWQRSKRPASRRTWAASAKMPLAYWTGMAQPAKSIRRAPRSSCAARRGVLFSPATIRVASLF